MDGFKKRTYRSLWDFLQDLGFIFKNRKRIRAIFRSESLSPAFRERMMLAVTQVNDCRYCARFHTKAALAEGISREEVDAILQGAFKDCLPINCPASYMPSTGQRCWALRMQRPEANSLPRTGKARLTISTSFCELSRPATLRVTRWTACSTASRSVSGDCHERRAPGKFWGSGPFLHSEPEAGTTGRAPRHDDRGR